MKTSRIATLALIATAAVGFNAYAESGESYPAQDTQKFVSTLTRAQVQAEAVKAARDNIQRGYNAEALEYLIGAPAAASDAGLTREAVRAEAIKARGLDLQIYSAG